MEYLTPEDIAIAEKNGISERLAKQRFYQRMWSRERSITEPIRTDLWRTCKDTCEKNGISNDVFRKRVNRGMSPELAATTPVHQPVVTSELISLARSNGIGVNTLKARIRIQKWKPQEAATVPVGSIKRLTDEQRKRRWFQ